MGRSAPHQTSDLMGHRGGGALPSQGQRFSKYGPGAAAPAAPGNSPGMQILRPHPRLLNQSSRGWGPVLRALLLPRGSPLEPEDQAPEQIFPTGGPRPDASVQNTDPSAIGPPGRVWAEHSVPSPAVPDPCALHKRDDFLSVTRTGKCCWRRRQGPSSSCDSERGHVRAERDGRSAGTAHSPRTRPLRPPSRHRPPFHGSISRPRPRPRPWEKGWKRKLTEEKEVLRAHTHTPRSLGRAPWENRAPSHSQALANRG